MATKARDAFRTISEVADWLDVPAHVLRFWESKFTQIKPVKRAGGRRYYRPIDMELIGGIKKLLHDDGMTIRGVQKMLKEDGVKAVSAMSPPLDGVEEASSPRTLRRKNEVLEAAVDDSIEDDTGSDPVQHDEQEAVDAWNADAKTESKGTPAAPKHTSLDITASPDLFSHAEDAPAAAPVEEDTAEDAPQQEQEDVPEAPFIDVEEEEPQLGGDNVVELNRRQEPASSSEPEAAPEPEIAPEPEAQAAPEPEPQAEPEPEAQAAPEPETPAEPEPEAQAAPEPEAPAEPEPEAQAEPEPEAQAEPEPEAQAAPEPEAQAEPEPEAQAAPEPEAQAEPEPEAQAEPEPEAEAQAAPVEVPATVEPTAQTWQLSDAQVVSQNVKRRLRGSDAAALPADEIAPIVARLQALRDRLAGNHEQ
ncbi:MerR family transcriptional regulator [uncultured Litoreibacter sp.]|uniref:MerR family transcriptional regulator n=1 Tax=uncultured Litoreibacter sp. TaxID=1392394 RepID=UPI002624F5F9|nr:MerR family transcriptional regulator [uncultured Litoreibacter sp.]